MTWNLMHLAAMLRGSGGLPTEGNQREKVGGGVGVPGEDPNPEYR